MKVLLVENDSATQDFLSMLLTSLDIELIEASTIEEGQKILQEHSSDLHLLISEFKINDVCSRVLYDYLIDNKLPIGFALFTKGKLGDYEEFTLFSRESRFNKFIPKPYKDDHFLDYIEFIEENIKDLVPPKNFERESFERDGFDFVKKFANAALSKLMELRIPKQAEMAANDILLGKLSTTELQDYLDKRKKREGEELEIKLKAKEIDELEINLTNEEADELSETFSKDESSELSGSFKDDKTGPELEHREGVLNESDIAPLKVPGYVSVKANRFYNFDESPCDIFLCLTQEKILKITHAGDLIEESIIDKYINKGIKYFYIKEDKLDDLNNLFVARLEAKLQRSDGNILNKSAVSLILTDVIYEQAAEFGVSQGSIIQSQKSMKLAEELLANDKNLSDLFNSVLRGKNYTSEHALLINLIATELAAQVNLATEKNLQKLSLAAVFHDIALNKIKRLTKIHDLPNSNLDEIDAITIQEHPQAAVDMIKDIDTISPDVFDIILQHHEKADGSGFPKGLNGNYIKPLSALFIISHEYADFIYRNKYEEKKETNEVFCARLKSFYSEGNLKKIFHAFMTTIGRDILGDMTIF